MSDAPDLEALKPPHAAGLPDETLEEVNRLWTIVRAFSNAAHDVNNALQVIAGSAELLEARDLDPAIRRRIETIRVESGKAAATIARLLSYARTPLRPAERLEIGPIVEAAVAMRTASLGRQRIAINVDRADAAFVVGSAPKLLQTLLDVLLLAEAEVAGRKNAQMAVGVTVSGGQVELRVASTCDEDSGTPEADASRGSTTAALTAQAERWAAAYLARSQGGELVVDGGTFTLKLKAG